MMRRLVVMACALAMAVGAGGAYVASNGLTGLGAHELQVAYPDYDEISNWDFMAAQYDALEAAGMNPELVLGSSELKSAPAGAAHPGSLFADGRFGHTALIAGRAGCNDLWQTIELGAFSGRLPEGRKRAVVFVSMQWFMCYRNPAESFPGVFSQGAYDAFMANDEISAGLKARVAERVRAYGVDADLPIGPLAAAVENVDREVASLTDDVRLGRKLAAAGGAEGPSASSVSTGDASCEEPDWDRVFVESDASARDASTNEYGFSDAWYERKFDHWLAGARKNWRVEDGAYFSSQEFEDFQLLLEVCEACGIEPLIVIQPVKGAAYDQTIYGREVREQYYDMIRRACSDAGAQVADFSEYEYDTYFLRDYSHPSPWGSAYYSKALYDFWEAS